jgi:hypothetical protein
MIPPQGPQPQRTSHDELKKAIDWLFNHPPLVAFLGSSFVVGLVFLFVVLSRPAERATDSEAPIVPPPPQTQSILPRTAGWRPITGRLEPGLDVYIRIGDRAPEYVFKILQVTSARDPELMLVQYPGGSIEQKRRKSFTVDSDAYVCWVE